MPASIAKEGINFLRAEFLALAFTGALLALSFWPAGGQISRTKAAIKVITGVVASCVSAPIVVHLIALKYPDLPEAGLYYASLAAFFWVGFFSTQLIRAAAAFIRRSPQSTNYRGDE